MAAAFIQHSRLWKSSKMNHEPINKMTLFYSTAQNGALTPPTLAEMTSGDASSSNLSHLCKEPTPQPSDVRRSFQLVLRHLTASQWHEDLDWFNHSRSLQYFQTAPGGFTGIVVMLLGPVQLSALIYHGWSHVFLQHPLDPHDGF